MQKFAIRWKCKKGIKGLDVYAAITFSADVNSHSVMMFKDMGEAIAFVESNLEWKTLEGHENAEVVIINETQQVSRTVMPS